MQYIYTTKKKKILFEFIQIQYIQELKSSFQACQICISFENIFFFYIFHRFLMHVFFLIF